MAPSIFGWKPFSKKKQKTQAPPVDPPTPSSSSQAPPASSSAPARAPSPVKRKEEIVPPPATPTPPATAHTPKVAEAVKPQTVTYNLPQIEDPQENTKPQETIDPSEIKDIRKLCPDFRVLVMGRANSGKTTIIQRMCDSNEDPVVHDEKGNKYPISVLKNPDVMRGIHNIDLEITFESNPNFKFHDSMGFEAGSTNEVDVVKAFIRRKLAETKLRKRLHAIWYCIPTDYNRVASDAELSFFEENTGDIPVVLVFTKWDGQIIRACNTLRYERGMPIAQAMKEAPELARTVLEERYIPVFKGTRHPPASYAVLGYMNNPDTKCSELAEKTAAVLNNGILKKLFVSVQTHNIQLCIKNGINEVIPKYIFSESLNKPLDQERVIAVVCSWFPHIFTIDRNYSQDKGDRYDRQDDLKTALGADGRSGVSARFSILVFVSKLHLPLPPFRVIALRGECQRAPYLFLPILTFLRHSLYQQHGLTKIFQPVISSSNEAFLSQQLQALNNAACAAIVATHSFDGKKNTYGYTPGAGNKGMKASIEEYLASAQHESVKSAITSKFRQHAESSVSDLAEDTVKEISEELERICLGNLLSRK